MNVIFNQLFPIYSMARIILIILDAVLFLGALYFFIKAISLRPRFRRKQTHHERVIALSQDESIRKHWSEIVRKFNTNPPQSYMFGIIEADTFVDEILKRIGLVGETMADRLKQLDSEELATLGRLWRVHRIRNALVHSPGFVVSKADADEALQVYELFLKELEIL